MDIDGMQIWQQGSGNGDTYYAPCCIEWDVILNGPGKHGIYPDAYDDLGAVGISARKRTDLGRFAVEMCDGDLVVLRGGTNLVYAVGEVVGEYLWSDIFGDVDGWDIQHVRRVRWLWHSLANPKQFDTYTLKQGDTTQRLDSQVVEDWLRELDIDNAGLNRELAALPDDNVGIVDRPHLSNAMFSYGVASASINNLMDEISELERIATWYVQAETAPSEHETVAYLAIPFLRVLGWTPQKMAVEWNNVDIALFDGLPRCNENLSVVVEAKRRGNSCLSAVGQAEGYALNHGGCPRLVVTDGIRYGVFVARGDLFELYAYMNLIRMRDAYPIYRCGGASDAILAMTPEWRV